MPSTVSVVIATYNRGARIARTLDSVLAQTRPPSEIVVIDDGSTDDTAAWIRSHYPDVRLFTVSNGGSSASRNRGAERAVGDVLVFLDHDDDMLPHCVETLVGLLERFPDAAAAFADHELLNVVDGQHFRDHHTEQPAFHRLRQIPVRATAPGGERTYGRELYYAMLSGNLLQQPWAVRRAAFADVGGFDPGIRYCEDWDMYTRLVRTHVVAVTDRVVSIHYIEGGNLHRVSGQDVQHMKVIRKLLAAGRFSDWRSVRILRPRLANYHKTRGDTLRHEHQPGAWSQYVKSLVTWPFDPVVWVRCVLWLPGALLEAVTPGRQPRHGDG